MKCWQFLHSVELLFFFFLMWVLYCSWIQEVAGTQTRARKCSISPLPKCAEFTLASATSGLPAMDLCRLTPPARPLPQVRVVLWCMKLQLESEGRNLSARQCSALARLFFSSPANAQSNFDQVILTSVPLSAGVSYVWHGDHLLP